MEAPPPLAQSASSSSSPADLAQNIQPFKSPAVSPVKSEAPAPELITVPDISPPVFYTISVPSCSGWFSWDHIHEIERRILPEFFDGRSSSKNPNIYKYYRDSIIGSFRANPSRKITFTESRRGLVGDVGSVRRVFDFLEAWGLINYIPSARPSPKEKKELGDTVERMDSSNKPCSNCKLLCDGAYFVTDKADITFCTRCFVRGNYRAGLNSSDFKRVAISEETKTEWTDKETLHLLEAILHCSDDWKKVAEHVGTRSEKDCVSRFLKLPFGEQFLGHPEFIENGSSIDAGSNGHNVANMSLSKRMRLTPLADASNPIMAQVTFLASMVGPELAEIASDAAIAALSEIELSSNSNSDDQTSVVYKKAAANAQLELINEQQDMEQSISGIVEVQIKDIQEKLVHFEELELLMEKEWQQLKYMKDLLFADQLTAVQHNHILTTQKL